MSKGKNKILGLNRVRETQNAETRRLRKIWTISSVLIFSIYISMVVLDVVFSDGSPRLIWLSVAGGIPLVIVTVLALNCTLRLGRIPLFMSLFNQIAFLGIGIFTQRLNSYFFIMLIIAGVFSLAKSFRQMLVFVLAGSFINIMFMAFVIPRLPAINGYIFFLQFLMTQFGSIILLIQTYNVMQKEGRSHRALVAFSSLLESTPNYMVITDSNTRVKYISKPLAEFAFFSSQELAVGKPLLDLFTDKKLKLMFADILGVYGYNETTMTIEVGGQERHYKVVTDKLAGDIDGMFIDIADITPTVNSQIEAEEAQERAERANAAKTNFLATMSHEIRTPLNAIIGITQIQMQKKDLPDEHLMELSKIYDSGSGLLGIINDILDLSKIETGKMELNPINYDMPSLINDAVQLNIVRIGSKEIRFALDINEDLPSRMIGDELRLKQILNNLLSNAIKYTDTGYVKLSVMHFVKDNGLWLRFIIEDTGQGMKPEDLQNLFSEYSRFNAEANRTTEGTGIGLTIADNLVAMMDGSIEVESEYGKGSVFTVTVKQQAVECEPIGVELSERLRNFSFGCTKQFSKMDISRELMPYGSVLVVDDVETNLYVAEGLMSPYGLTIDTALSGFETLDKINSGNTYDIIFMDHMMPHMDGIETTQKLRGMGYMGSIVALTANALVGNDEMFKQHGFDDFISKPIDIRHLNAVLNKFVRDAHPEEAKKHKVSIADAADAADVADSVDGAAIHKINPKLLGIFKRDAAKAIVTLRETLANNDLKLFTTTAHAMKSALANVGENDKSALAAKLEDAGLKNDTDFIQTNVETLVKALEELIDNAESSSDDAVPDDSNMTEDITFMKEQLQIIKQACEDYDDTTAYTALNRLREMQWKKQTATKLEDIHETLFLHSDFELAAEKAEELGAALIT
jgi:signal transduction histidine kinase/CheY-like chemotaxis protein